MRICFISDTHKHHNCMKFDIPECDLLIHAGDICGSGYSLKSVNQFLYWYDSLVQAKNKILVAGNHDRVFENIPDRVQEVISKYNNVIYLQDECVVIDGVKIYGSPWQPAFCNWAFNLERNGNELFEKWNNIPQDTDILVTHGPPKYILDHCKYGGDHAGCGILRSQIFDRLNLRIHHFGHIHECYGTKYEQGVLFVNSSICTLNYHPNNMPILVYYDEKETIVLEEGSV